MARLIPRSEIHGVSIGLAALIVMVLAYTAVALAVPRPSVTHLGGDSQTYLQLAQDLLDTGRYAERWPEEEPFRAWRPPLYPLFLAGVLSLAAGDPSTIVDIQIVLYVLSGILVFEIATTMSETLFVFLMLAAIYLVVRFLKTEQIALGVCAAGSLAGCVLTRTVLIPVVALLAFAYVGLYVYYRWWGLSPGWCFQSPFTRKLALLFAVFSAIVAVWIIRTYAVLGKFVPINTANGMNLYLGTLPSYDWREVHRATINPLRRQLGEVGSMHELTRMAVRNTLQHPASFLYLKAKTALKHLLIAGYESRTGLPLSLLGLLAFLVNLGYATVKRNVAVLIFNLCFLAFLAATCLVFYSRRFSLVLYPPYAILMANGGIVLLDSAANITWHQSGFSCPEGTDEELPL